MSIPGVMLVHNKCGNETLWKGLKVGWSTLLHMWVSFSIPGGATYVSTLPVSREAGTPLMSVGCTVAK